jgi:hypothetical protein
MDWIHLAQDRMQQQALAEKVMKFGVSKNAQNFINI